MNISSAPTKNVTCSAGACSPTAKGAIFNVADLQNLLATSDVTVNTGAGAVTIEITSPLAWSSAHRLTLSADYNVSIKAAVAVEGTGALTVIYHKGGMGGQFLFFPGGKIDFWDTASELNVDGNSYRLVNDIVSMASIFAGDQYASVALAKDYDAGPDGTYHASGVPSPMYGNFDGLGHTISNFSASGTTRMEGLFSQNLNQYSIIRNVTLSNVNVRGGTDALAGALAGSISGTVLGVHASGRVSAGDGSSAGGLTGYGGTYIGSDASVAVTCSKRCEAGGMVGFGGLFSYSHASGVVTTGPGGEAGGLAGFLGGTIVQSYATGDVVSSRAVNPVTYGGLVGVVGQHGSITDSYALGAVRNEGESTLGGLIGFGQASIVKNAYSTGLVGSAATPHHHIIAVGGFLGFADHVDKPSGAYWDIDTSGLTVGCGASKPRNGCPSITGLSDTALKSGLPAGFDPAIWAQSASINNGYPYLIANPPQ